MTYYNMKYFLHPGKRIKWFFSRLCNSFQSNQLNSLHGEINHPGMNCWFAGYEKLKRKLFSYHIVVSKFCKYFKYCIINYCIFYYQYYKPFLRTTMHLKGPLPSKCWIKYIQIFIDKYSILLCAYSDPDINYSTVISSLLKNFQYSEFHYTFLRIEESHFIKSFRTSFTLDE